MLQEWDPSSTHYSLHLVRDKDSNVMNTYLHRWSLGNLSWVSSKLHEGEATSPKAWIHFLRPTCSSSWVDGANLLPMSCPYNISPDTRWFHSPLASFSPSLNETVMPRATEAISCPWDSKHKDDSQLVSADWVTQQKRPGFLMTWSSSKINTGNTYLRKIIF